MTRTHSKTARTRAQYNVLNEFLTIKSLVELITSPRFFNHSTARHGIINASRPRNRTPQDQPDQGRRRGYPLAKVHGPQDY